MKDVTRILDELQGGDATAADRLLEVVYAELRVMAAQRMAGERKGHTLAPTELVHEAYLRLMNGSGAAAPFHESGPSVGRANWHNRAYFFVAAAEAMRRILVEQARRRSRLKHGGGLGHVSLADGDAMQPDDQWFDASDQGLRSEQVLAIHAALERFAAEAPEKAELVKLRYFAGLSLEQAAEVLGISRATASRHWAYSRAWLLDAMG
jgi:RNA polymerase sigma factor (TIGR02999 family)